MALALEKSSFKVYEEAGETGEFPKTDFLVKVEGDDYTNVEEVSLEEHIEGINITKALKAIPTEIVTTITPYENGTRAVTNVTEKYENNQTD